MKRSHFVHDHIELFLPNYRSQWHKVVALVAVSSTIVLITFPILKLMVQDNIKRFHVLKEKFKRIFKYISSSLKEEQFDAENLEHTYIHRGIVCSHCEFPIVGIRYKCLNCSKFNLCSNCEKNAVLIHNELHIFTKIYVPIPALLEFPVFPTLYPGKPLEYLNVPYDRVIQLSYETHFTTQEIHELFSQFKTLCVGTVIPKSVFIKCLGSLKPTNIIEINLFHLFRDSNEEGITFYSFVKGLSIMTRGTLEEKAEYAFKGYEPDGSGYITKEQYYNMIVAELNAKKDSLFNDIDEYQREALDIRDEDQSESSSYNDLFSRIMKHREDDIIFELEKRDNASPFTENVDEDKLNVLETLYLKTAEDITEESFKHLQNGQGKISKTDFLHWIKNDQRPLQWIEFGKQIF